MLNFLKTIVFLVLFCNIIFALTILDNGAEIFHINSDAQIGALGGNNPSIIGINGKIFNNPALGNIKTNDIISFTYRDHFSGLANDHIFSAVIKQNLFNSLSIGMIYREINNIPNTLNAFYLNGNTVVPINYDLITVFDHWELATVFSISSQLSKYKIGFNIKTLMYSVLNEKAYGLGRVGYNFHTGDDDYTDTGVSGIDMGSMGWGVRIGEHGLGSAHSFRIYCMGRPR